MQAAANHSRPTSSGPRPPAYIKGSAVSSAGHWHNITVIDPNRAEPSRGFTFFNLSFEPSFIFLLTMADTQVDSGSDISAKVSRPHAPSRSRCAVRAEQDETLA